MSKKKKINGFVYKADLEMGELLIPNFKDSFAEGVFSSIRAKMSDVTSLPNSLSISVYPLKFVERGTDILMRSYFKKENYHLLAARIDENDEIIDFLLVEKANSKCGLVVSYSKLEVEVSFHDGCHVEEDEDSVNPIDIFAESLNGDLTLGVSSSKKPTNLGYAKIEQEEEEDEEIHVEVSTPFIPNSNKTIKNLGVSKIIAQKEANEEEDEDEPYVSPVNIKKTFTPTSKRGIPNLGSRFDEKKKKVEQPVTKEKKKQPKEEKDVENSAIQGYFEPNSKKMPGKIIDRKPSVVTKTKQEEDNQGKPISVTPAPFSPLNNKKPKAIGDDYQWVSRPNVRFEFDKAHPQSKLMINHGEYERDFDFGTYLSRFASITSIRIRFNCAFAPEVLEEKSPEVKSIEVFDVVDWNLLAVFVDAYRRPYRYLFCHKDNPYLSFACTLEKKASAYLVSTIGFRLALYKGDYQDLLDESHLYDKKEEYDDSDIFADSTEEAVSEEKNEEPEPEIAEEEIKEEAPVEIEKKENPREKAKELRKILYTGHFKRQLQSFIEDNPVDGKEEFLSLLFSLQTMQEEDLSSFLLSKNAKVIVTGKDYRVRKFRFSGHKQFSAMRVFYLRGDSLTDFDRKIGPKDFVLIALSIKHEGQDKIAEIGLRHFGENTPVYFFAPPKFEPTDEKLVHLSSEQYHDLDVGESKLPAAFVGTAGSGKTLMSYQAYLDLCENDGKVLYLTYQRDLARQAEKTLSKMNAKNAEALTYRDLIKKIFGENEAKRMRTKDRFRAWFVDHCEKNQKNYNREFSRQVSLLSSSIEDAFHIAYVFYRGIIEGTIDAFEKSKKGYLSKEDFLSKTGGEMGFEKEQKEAIYWIANEYEKHLARHNGMTDNKFALKILTNEPQRIYDAIIVDEYQDLTELQILSLTNLLKPTLPHRILLFGDDNQAVNPTILNVSSVNSVIQYAYKKDKKRCELHINTLSSSYRSGPNLLSYINDVLLIKDKAIGKDKNENILARKTFREDEDDLYVTRLEDPSLFETLLLSAKDSDKDAVFIFPSATLRDEAKEKYASILEGYEKDNFLSVEESKGREWDSCVLVNFFSSSKEIYEGMLGEDRIGHKSTVHRMMFNRYYVALTRAENRVVVYEEDAGELSRKHFLSSLNELSSESDIKRIFVGELDPEHWIRVGDQLFAKGDYVGSSRAYRRGNKDERAKEKLERSELYRDAFSFSLNEIESIEGILRYRDYASLEDYYEERNLYERKKLFATLRNEKIEPDEKLEVFKSCYGDLLDIERKYAYNLIVRSYDKRIRKKLRFLNKKQ